MRVHELAVGEWVRRHCAIIAATLCDEPHHILVLRLTAFLVLLHGAAHVAVLVPLRVLCGLLLVCPPLTGNIGVWLLLVLALTTANSLQWFQVDNHVYLMNCWVVVCAISISVRDPAGFLKASARVLVGLVFAAAFLWKVVGGEYRNGWFLTWTFTTDSRFQEIGAALVGIDASELAQFGDAIRLIASMGAVGATIQVPDFGSLSWIAKTLSWLVLLSEGMLAVLWIFLIERVPVMARGALIAFIIGTYFLAPVTGFGFLIALMGLAQCGPFEASWRIRYLAVIAIVLTLLPWTSAILTD